MHPNIERLQGIRNKLPTGHLSAADSIVYSYKSRGTLTSKQWDYVDSLIRMAETGPQAAIDLGSMTGIIDLFKYATGRLKAPAVILNVYDVGEIKITLAGKKARVPGSVNVTTNAPYGESIWYGRITKDGKFTPSMRERTPDNLIRVLLDFAERPADVAADHGKLTGKCCFCNRKLTDERSTELGYGPTCAQNYKLPYGAVDKAPNLFSIAGNRK